MLLFAIPAKPGLYISFKVFVHNFISNCSDFYSEAKSQQDFSGFRPISKEQHSDIAVGSFQNTVPPRY